MSSTHRPTNRTPLHSSGPQRSADKLRQHGGQTTATDDWRPGDSPLLTGRVPLDEASSASSFRPYFVTRPAGAFAVTAEGDWTFAPTSAAYALGPGSEAHEMFEVSTADGALARVVISLIGTHDGALICAGEASQRYETADEFDASFASCHFSSDDPLAPEPQLRLR